MFYSKLLFICFVWSYEYAVAGGEADIAGTKPRNPVTVTPSGKFLGSWMSSRRGRQFQAYRGIRYAEPPIGELRFQPPKPILFYTDEVNATEDGPACPRVPTPGADLSEDCLIINVYTPDNNSAKPLPVVFFLHPGGFYSGTGRSQSFGPHYLLDKDVVLVTINYRLGTLGFLSTGDELAPGNNGFKDQVAALKWVRRNIRSFGGNPDLVTITGCSAGSTSVMLHMISPMSKGLFHRGISMSAAPMDKEPLSEDLYPLAVRQAELVNCPTDNSSAIVSCLKNKPWEEISGSLLGFFEFGYDPVTIWKPVVEKDFGQDRFLDVQPTDAVRARRLVTPVPHMIGQTSGEFFWKAYTILNNDTLLNAMNANWTHVAPISFQLPRHNASYPTERLRQAYLGGKLLQKDKASAVGLGRLYADGITAFRVHRMANLMCRHSPHKVFYYEFAYTGNHSFYEDPETKKPEQAAHHDDLVYLFFISTRFPMIPVDDSLDSRLVDRMTAIWYNFVRYGDPKPACSDQEALSSLEWPHMAPRQREYLRIGDQFSVHSRLGEKRFQLWDELYPIQY